MQSKEMEKLLKSLEDQKRKAEEAVDADRRASEARIRELEAHVRMVETQCRLDRIERIKVCETYAELQKEDRSAQAASEEDRRAAGSDPDHLQEEARDPKARIAELKRLLESAQDVVKEREAKLAAVMKLLKGLPMADVDTEGTGYGASERETLVALKKELEIVKEKEDSFVDQCSIALAEVGRLERQWSNLGAQLSQLSTWRETRIQQVTDLSKILGNQEKANESLREEKKTADETLARLREEKEMMQVDLSDLRQQLEETNASKEAEVSAHVKENEELQLRLFEAEGQVEILQERLRHVERDAQDGFDGLQNEDSAREIEHMNELHTAKMRLAEMEQQHSSLKRGFAELEALLTAKEAQIEGHGDNEAM